MLLHKNTITFFLNLILYIYMYIIQIFVRCLFCKALANYINIALR